MNRWRLVLSLVLVTAVGAALVAPAAWAQQPGKTLSALIVTGQNNHDWKVSTPILKQVLEDTGLFAVAVATSPPAGGDMASFAPNLAAYDVVVLDYTGDGWPEETKKAFVQYVTSGGGVVVYHAASNAFPDWPEFNEIIGLGGWGGRDEKSGPYVRWRNGRVVYDTSPGRGGNHGTQHAFKVVNRVKDHPITQGLPREWMHAQDELYSELRGPAKNLTLLATAYSAPEQKGTGEDEPVLFTIRYGEGRIFHTVLGHVGGAYPPPAVQCVGFIVTLQRGAEWAATGNVTQAVPDDFPTAAEVRTWPKYRPVGIGELLTGIAAYEYGQSLAPLVELDEYLRTRLSRGQDLAHIEIALLAFLATDATLDAKKFVCKKLSLVGTEVSVPVLAPLLRAPVLADIARYGLDADMARYALERIPDESAARALRDALGELEGAHRIGVIASLGVRRDSSAVKLLAPLLEDASPEVAAAAIAALGRIGTQQAFACLNDAQRTIDGALRPLLIDALLQCTENFASMGRRSSVFGIYRRLFEEEESAPVRIAALRGMAATIPRNTCAPLTGVLRGEDEAMQAIACGIVREMKDPVAVATLAAGLADLPVSAQVKLAPALAATGEPSALNGIIGAARSGEPCVRIAALEALGALGNAAVVMMLADRAASAEGSEADAARASLYRLRAPGVDQVIVAAVTGAGTKVRLELVRSIAERRIPSGARTLLDTAADPDPEIRVASLKGLRVVGNPAIMPKLVDIIIQMTGDDLEEAKKTLVLVASQIEEVNARAAAILAALPSAERLDAKCILLSVMGSLGDVTALPVLCEALKEEQAEIRRAAVEGLSEWPDTTPAGELFAVAKQGPGEELGSLALRGYVRLVGLKSDRPAAETVAMYQEAMAIAVSTEDKQRVIAGLADTRDAAALPPLSAAVKDADAEVGAAAVKALADWPDDTPLAALLKVARESANETHRVLALRGYVRLIGVNPERPSDEAAAMYKQATELASNADELKMVLSGLSRTPNVAALRIAAVYLEDPALKEEAEVAVAKIGAAVAGSYPEETKETLAKVVAGSESRYAVKKAKAAIEQIERFEGYVTAWQMSGPYMKPGLSGNKLFDAAFAPETDPDKATWKVMPAGTNEGMPFLIEFDKALGGENRAAYVRTNVWSDQAQDARIELGSGDGVKVWLNGGLVHANNATRGNTPDEDTFDVGLKEGWNPLLVKVVQGGGEWSLSLRFRTRGGGKIEGVIAQPGDTSAPPKGVAKV